MKKIVMSLFTIMAVVAVVGGVTHAVFSSNATSTGNTFTTADDNSIKVSLSGDNDGVGGPFFTLTNMMPGDTETKRIVITNDGSMDMFVRLYLTGSDPSGLRNHITATVLLNPSSTGLNLYAGELNETVPAQPLAGLWGQTNAISNRDFAPSAIAPGESIVLDVTMELPITLGNHWQGRTLNMNIVVDAVQSANQETVAPGDILWN